MAEKLFAEFPPVSTEKWEEVILKDLKGADYDKKLIWKSQEGFSVRPYYRAEDLLTGKKISGYPGIFPFVRGTNTTNEWLIRQTYSAKEGYREANKLALDGILKGVTSVGFLIDGESSISVQDIALLLDAINLENIEINFVGCGSKTAEIIKSFTQYVQSKNINPDKIKGSFDYDPLRDLSTTGYLSHNYKGTIKECIEAVKEFPKLRPIGVYAYMFNDAGSTIVQELGYGLAMGSEYLHILTEEGVTADEAASRIGFTFSVGSSYFMEIAKFRAARVLWANIANRYGVKNGENSKITTHARTSQWNQTVYDAHVNMLRSTTEAMSAAIAGVDSLEVLPFDNPFRKADEFSNRIARNTQSVLKQESHFDKIVDPSAGSYYIETLTREIADNSWKIFCNTEESGGYIKMMESGEIQSVIKASADKRDKNIATRRETLLGTNQFPNFNEIAGKDISSTTVNRSVNPIKADGMAVEPFAKYRGSQLFETLRYTTDKSGNRPKVFMLTFGNLAMCRARAQFSGNFFAVAGYQIMDNTRFASVEEGVKVAKEAKADIIVACSSDDEYADAVPKIKQLAGADHIVVVAGDPECKEALISQGITNFINVKSNVLETLRNYQNLLGIK